MSFEHHFTTVLAHHLCERSALLLATECGRAGRGIHQHERREVFGVIERETHCDEPTHRMAEQTTATNAEPLQETLEVSHLNADAVRVVPPDVAGVAVSTLIEREHTTSVREPRNLVLEVELAAGESVHQHERCPVAGALSGARKRAWKRALVVVHGGDSAMLERVGFHLRACGSSIPAARNDSPAVWPKMPFAINEVSASRRC